MNKLKYTHKKEQLLLSDHWSLHEQLLNNKQKRDNTEKNGEQQEELVSAIVYGPLHLDRVG